MPCFERNFFLMQIDRKAQHGFVRTEVHGNINPNVQYLFADTQMVLNLEKLKNQAVPCKDTNNKVYIENKIHPKTQIHFHHLNEKL